MTRPHHVFGPNPPGRLPAAMVRALAAELSDPGRFTRAKSYARDGAVFDIEIEPGEARGQIQGTRYEPYVATLHVAPADDVASLLGLVPGREEISAECTCPDDGPYGGAFCKHALATLLVIADEITADPSALLRWRSGVPCHRDGHAAQDDPSRRQRRQPVAPAVDVLAAALTAPASLPDPPVIPARLPVAMAGGDEGAALLAAVLADALAALRAG